MKPSSFTVVGLGELLWDLLPDGKQLGGAPANFAYMTALLGDRGIVASRVGTDRLGQEAMWRLASSGLDISSVQQDMQHATGTVRIELDSRGQAAYQFVPDVAWDHLQWTPEWKELAESADAVCFGSLAQRSEESRAAIRNFLASVRPGTLRIFDVNLRQNFFSAAVLRESAAQADILKLNREEAPKLLQCLGRRFENDLSAARWLASEFAIRIVCMTRGPKGSLLLAASEQDEHPGFAVKVADTVGAGDAFTAALLYHALRGASLRAMNEAANQLGAWVASQEGAMPEADEEVLAKVRAGKP